MKVEQRIVYISEDGTEFFTETDCKQYESNTIRINELKNLIDQESSLLELQCEEVAVVIFDNLHRIKEIMESNL